MKRAFKNVLVTGGAGFIGVNFIRYLFEKTDFDGKIVNFDALTYAANPASLSDVEKGRFGSRYSFVRGDICDRAAVERVFDERGIDAVVHFAAESHVDRSILGPEAFIRTNILGTFTLLDVARGAWKDRDDALFHHISTDEVFGSLGATGHFLETTPYDPRSPYSASKAGSDHLVRAYHHTYGLPITLSNCSNNYGPYQFPEKLVPLMILNMLEGKNLPVYGDGTNVRDWLFVEDHASAIWAIMREAKAGSSYNVGGENEWENIRLLGKLIGIVADRAGLSPEAIRATITHVKDRPGHDQRYAIDCGAIKRDLGWKQSVTFDEGLERTVGWYLANREWTAGIRSGEYRKWIERNYAGR
jgi:dTDP-glucose 4,6-dehydratase